MQKLSALDLAMFVLESAERPFGVGPLIVLRPPKGAGKGFADRLVERMLVHKPRPPFNMRLALSLTQLPGLEEIKDPDLSGHVHRLTLAGDGSLDNLIATVCELQAQRIDRSGLLWQFYVIDGLADGRIALYGKVHHGIIDGRTFVRLMIHWFSTDPKDPEVRAMWQGVPPDKSVHDGAEALSAGKRRANGGVAGAMLRSAAGTVRSAASLTGLLATQGLRSLGLNSSAMALPFVSVPRVLMGKPTGKRNYAFTTLPLAEVKALGKSANASVNDVLLTVLDAALGRFLGDGSEQPSKPLVVDMPVALPAAAGGNMIAVLQLPMGRARATVRERLSSIVEETARVKAAAKNVSGETLMLYTALVHAVPTLLERLGVAQPLLLSNFVFSNPFGFTGRPFLMGAEVELVMPLSLLAAGQTLNITVVTLGDQLQIGFLGMPGAVDHIERLAELTHEAFGELKKAVGEPPIGRRKPAARATQAPAAASTARKRVATVAKPKTPKAPPVNRRSVAKTPAAKRVARTPARA
jgi:diacylglycerol O-acyltransferase